MIMNSFLFVWEGSIQFLNWDYNIRLQLEQRQQILSMILNQQLIQDMFQDQNSKDLISLPREDISLNFTASSRSSKNKKKQGLPFDQQPSNYQSANIIDMAAQQLNKFNQWVTQTDTNYSLNLDNLHHLIEEIETETYQMINYQDLAVIKEQLFKHDQEERIDNCHQCTNKNRQIQQLQQLNQDQDNILYQKDKEIHQLKQRNICQAVSQVKDYMLAEVQKNFLKNQIKDLHHQINALKNQKITLERTFLFNKTRNSEINILQKSKDLSAAKNSTNSSEILNRNHQTIVFIDPIQSDVEQWIKFFQSQRNRYRLICKKQQNQKQKEIGRALTKEERQIFESEEKVCILFNSIKQILRSLTKIRQNTSSFEQTEIMNKSALRDKTLKHQQEAIPFKQQYQKLNVKYNKLVKINQYLLREKQNLQEISISLKQERLKQNNQRNYLTQVLKRETIKVNQLSSKLKQCEQSIKQLNQVLIQKEQQILFCFQQIKKLKKNAPSNDKNWHELQNKCRFLQSRLKEVELQNQQYLLKLKKQSREKKKVYNQIEDIKGPFRIYCIVRESSVSKVQSYMGNEGFNTSIFHKILSSQSNEQEKLLEDIKKVIICSPDNSQLTIFNYGYAESGKGSFVYGEQPFACRILKNIFKSIETEKDVKVQVTLNIFQMHADKIIDLIDYEKSIKQLQPKEENSSLIKFNESFADNFEEIQQIYFKTLNKRKGKQILRSHIIIRASIDLLSPKTNQRHHSKINLVDLADDLIRKQTNPFISKSLFSLSKCLLSFHNKQKIVPYRESKLTQLLKESFNANNKIFMLVNISSSLGKQQIRQSFAFAQGFKSQKVRRNEQIEENTRARKSLSRKNI